MARLDQIYEERLKKLQELQKKKINPYPSSFDVKDYSSELKEKYSKLKNDEKTKNKAKISGRILVIRDIGKIIFASVLDSKGTIQIILQEDETPKNTLEFFKKYIDTGDFIGAEGSITKTKRGELSILIENVTLLAKSLLPLPEKWHGLQDEEERYRKRYLDLIMNPELKEMFIKKSIFWNTMREFLSKRGFIEVETPVLENTPGGADAQPFITHHNSLDIDVYLRISMGELWQKRLMVAGYDKTFEIGRQFRNEGISPEHLQDYTQMEFYWAYADYEKGMELVEEMYKEIAKNVLGSLIFKKDKFTIDLGKKWQKLNYADEIKKQTKLDVLKATEKDVMNKLKELKIDFEKNLEKPRLIDLLWKSCRKNIQGPAFVINPPVEISPLAKRNSRDPRVVDRYWVIIAGSELGNGYSELNDPIDQEDRFKKQSAMREKGDVEAQMHDKEFVEALKYGMPPTTGFGVSERFFAFLMNKPIRECVLFPLLKPKKE